MGGYYVRFAPTKQMNLHLFKVCWLFTTYSRSTKWASYICGPRLVHENNLCQPECEVPRRDNKVWMSERRGNIYRGSLWPGWGSLASTHYLCWLWPRWNFCRHILANLICMIQNLQDIAFARITRKRRSICDLNFPPQCWIFVRGMSWTGKKSPRVQISGLMNHSFSSRCLCQDSKTRMEPPFDLLKVNNCRPRKVSSLWTKVFNG